MSVTIKPKRGSGAPGSGDLQQYEIAIDITNHQLYYSPDGTNNEMIVGASDTLTSLSLAANTLTYTDENGDDTDIDLSLYLDDTNLARIVSGSLDGAGIATFTRDDATSFTIDFSPLFDDTNLARITSAGFDTGTGTLTLTRDDASTVTASLDGRYLQNLNSTSIDELSDVDTTTSAPTDGQVLTWNNTDGEWQPADSTGGLGNVVEDTTPQLGGDLDVNDNAIYNAGSNNYFLIGETSELSTGNVFNDGDNYGPTTVVDISMNDVDTKKYSNSRVTRVTMNEDLGNAGNNSQRYRLNTNELIIDANGNDLSNASAGRGFASLFNTALLSNSDSVNASTLERVHGLQNNIEQLPIGGTTGDLTVNNMIGVLNGVYAPSVTFGEMVGFEHAVFAEGSHTITDHYSFRSNSTDAKLVNAGPAILSGLEYPTSDGTDGQVLTTDGLGNLTFSTVSGGGGLSQLTYNATDNRVEVEDGVGLYMQNADFYNEQGNIQIDAGYRVIASGYRPLNNSGVQFFSGSNGMEIDAGVIALQITAATQASPVVLTVENSNYIHTDGEEIIISGMAAEMSGFTDGNYYAKYVTDTSDQLELYTDSGFTTPYDGSAFGAYSGSGGQVDSANGFVRMRGANNVDVEALYGTLTLSSANNIVVNNNIDLNSYEVTANSGNDTIISSSTTSGDLIKLLTRSDTTGVVVGVDNGSAFDGSARYLGYAYNSIGWLSVAQINTANDSRMLRLVAQDTGTGDDGTHSTEMQLFTGVGKDYNIRVRSMDNGTDATLNVRMADGGIKFRESGNSEVLRLTEAGDLISYANQDLGSSSNTWNKIYVDNIGDNISVDLNNGVLGVTGLVATGGNNLAIGVDLGNEYFFEIGNEVVVEYNEAGCEMFRGLQLAQCTTGTTDPASPTQGDLFVNTTSQELKRYDGSTWVSLAQTGGMTVFSTTDNTVVFYNGTSWQKVTSSAL